jgi:hypothetical protein
VRCAVVRPIAHQAVIAGIDDFRIARTAAENFRAFFFRARRLTEACIVITDSVELAAVEAALAEALAAGVDCINDERVNTIKLADAALEAAKELIDEVYTVVGLQ